MMRILNRFTMVELLAVISIILILASFLLPALSKARDKARTLVCLNNIKQILTAFTLYADDYNASLVAPLTDPATQQTWNLVLLQENYLTSGHGSDIFTCPSYPPYSYSDATSSNVYGMRYVEDPQNASNPSAPWNQRNTALLTIQNPSEYLFIADSVHAGLEQQWYVVAALDLLSDLKLHARHGSRVNCGYMDGSARQVEASELNAMSYNLKVEANP